MTACPEARRTRARSFVLPSEVSRDGLIRSLAILSLALCGCARTVAPTEPDGSWQAADGGVGDKDSGTIRYQAEEHTRQEGCSVATNNAGYSGSGFMDFGGRDTWIEWDNVTVASAGHYLLTLRYANAGAADRPGVVTVNGQAAGTVPFSRSGTWTDWAEAPIAVTLQEGANTVRITASTGAGGPNVDHADLTPTDLCPTDPDKTAPGRCGCGVPEGSCDDDDGALIEAEDRTAQSGCSTATNNAGYTGSGFIDFGGRDTWIEWDDIRVPLAGDYQLRLRYANGGGTQRPATVEVNGSTAGTVPFGITGSWTNWTDGTIVVRLREGRNRLRVRATTGAGGPNIDHAELTARDLCTDDPEKTEPGECGCGVPEGTCDDPVSSLYEAEERTAESGCSPATNNAGFTGAGFMDFGGRDTWIEWDNVLAPTAGDYTLRLRYANAGAGDRPAAVEVNAVSAGTVQFARTGTWTDWRDARIAVSLRAGTNTVRIRATTGAGGPNLDHGEFTRGVAASSVPLPIEVLGPAGTSETVQIDVDDPSDVTHLYVRCNACGYHNADLDSDSSRVKAAVRINGGPRIALKHYTGGSGVVGNRSIEVIGAEADYGGIGGAYRTVRIKVPVDGIVAGVNTVTFEHVTPAAPSIGFRIIDLNLLRNDSLFERVLSEADFVHDDPTTWAPPRTSSSDIEAGRNLWSRRNSLYDIGVDAIDGQLNGRGPVDGDIVASCADCHARDGRDLAYFNFSNHSIIERSVFHGLSRAEGERIAAYVRSLDIPVVAEARPWNPAYQPGPGMDARSTYEWAAGAGVDAILDSDAEMAPYLFPGGESLGAVRGVVDRYSTLNLRELPVSLPMPEWNQWLPIIHPDDAFNTNATAIRSDYRGVNVGQPYYKTLYDTARNNPTPTNMGRMTLRIKAWLRRDLTCQVNGARNGEPWRGLNGAVLSQIKLPTPKAFTASNCNQNRSREQDEPHELTKRGLAAWMAVKLWEIVHSNNLEAEGSRQTRTVCSGGRCVDASERRGWVVDHRNVFDRPPHFTGHGSREFYGQDRVSGLIETNAWYHLNMVLNSGHRRTMPTHFAYVYSHVELLQLETDVDQGYRFWAGLIKQRQLQTNGEYGVEAGLDLRTAQPCIYYAAKEGDTDTQASVGQPLWGRLAQAMVEDFVEDASNASAQDWANASGNSAVQARNSTDFGVCNSCFNQNSRTDPFQLGAYQGRNTYRVIPKLRQIGVANSALNALIDWGDRTWPNADWDALR